MKILDSDRDSFWPPIFVLRLFREDSMSCKEGYVHSYAWFEIISMKMCIHCGKESNWAKRLGLETIHLTVIGLHAKNCWVKVGQS